MKKLLVDKKNKKDTNEESVEQINEENAKEDIIGENVEDIN